MDSSLASGGARLNALFGSSSGSSARRSRNPSISGRGANPLANTASGKRRSFTGSLQQTPQGEYLKYSGNRSDVCSSARTNVPPNTFYNPTNSPSSSSSSSSCSSPVKVAVSFPAAVAAATTQYSSAVLTVNEARADDVNSPSHRPISGQPNTLATLEARLAACTAKDAAKQRATTYHLHCGSDPRSHATTLMTAEEHQIKKRHVLQRDPHELYRTLARIQESCGYGLDEEEELAKMTSLSKAAYITPPWLQDEEEKQRRSEKRGIGHGLSAHVEKESSNSGKSLNHLAADALLSVLEFCDIRSLGHLAHVNARFYVLTKCGSIWALQAEMRGMTVHHASTAKEELKHAMEDRAHTNGNELRSWEGEYNRISKRMSERAAKNYTDDIDVDQTLAAHNPHAILTGDFSTEGKAKENEAAIQKMQAEVVKLDRTRADIVAQMERNAELIEAQRKQLHMLESILRGTWKPDQGKEKNEIATTKITNAPGGENGSFLASLPLRSEEDLEKFERRIVRLVLRGRNTTAATTAQSPGELPVVLRRGITDFGTLEVLCGAPLLSPVGPESSISGGGAAAASALGGMNEVKKRWAAFKRFFPLGEDYYTVRSILHSLANTGSERAIAKKMEPLLQRILMIVARIDAMKDHEVLDVVM